MPSETRLRAHGRGARVVYNPACCPRRDRMASTHMRSREGQLQYERAKRYIASTQKDMSTKIDGCGLTRAPVREWAHTK